MLFPSATVVAALVISLASVAPLEARTATRGAQRSVGGAPTKIAAGLWAPKKSKPRPARDEDPREEELLKSKSSAGGGGDAPTPKRRRPIKMEDGQDEGEDESEGDDEDDDDKPKVSKRRKRVAEEEEEDVAEPISSQPSVIPRLINFEVGTAVMRRSFAFNQASLQKDKGIRMGYQLALESFPLVSQPSGWYRTLGIGASYEKEYGDSTQSGATGLFMGYPFNQSRWGFDARYAIPAGDWVVIMPAVGYGHIGADLQSTTTPLAADCTATMSAPCFGDIKASYLSADVHIRVGLTPTVALSLSGGYIQGLGVSRGMDQITNQAPASMNGFHVDAGATMLLGDWFALQVAVPFRRYIYTFDAPMGSSFTYRGATDLYYGLMAGLAVLTR